MADTPPPAAPSLEDRLNGAAGRLKTMILTAVKLRPTDESKAADYDAMLSGMLDSLTEITAAASVDQASILLAKDLLAQSQQAAIERQKLRDATDIALAERAIPFPFSQKGASA